MRKRSVGFTVKALANQIRRLMDKSTVIGREDECLTGMQFGVIVYVADRCSVQDVFQKDIETEFNVRRSTATGILQLMERNGLLRREPMAYDARLKKIILTEKAVDLHQKIVGEIEKIEERITRGIAEEELDIFFDIMSKLSKNME